MLAFIIFVAFANFALGASAYHILSSGGGWRLRTRIAPPTPEPAPAEPPTAEAAADQIPSPSIDSSSSTESDSGAMPEQWLSLLQAEAVETHSFVEAAVETFRLEVGRYRRQLVAIDDRLREAGRQGAGEMVSQILADLDEVNAGWLEKQVSATNVLADRQGTLGSFEETAAQLHDTLAQQASQIESTRGNLSQMSAEEAAASEGARPLKELCRLFDLAHALRDRMQDAMAAILRTERRLDQVERRMQFDRDTGLFTRLGLEVLLHDWWKEDPGRIRLASMVLVDLDHCGRLNEKLGASQVDSLLDALAGQLNELIRKERGFDRMARLGGQSFVLFLGDTGPRQATSAAERIRQTLRVVTFQTAAGEIDLSTSLSVAEIGKQEDPHSLLARLRSGLRIAKQCGRNRTCLDEGQGFQVVEPPLYQVKPRTVMVGSVPAANNAGGD